MSTNLGEWSPRILVSSTSPSFQPFDSLFRRCSSLGPPKSTAADLTLCAISSRNVSVLVRISRY